MIRPGNAPINTAIHDKAPPRLNTIWTQWFTNFASLFSKNGQVTVVIAGPSPFVYQNPNTYLEQVLVGGGAVSKIEYSRDGVNYFVVSNGTNDAILLSGNDYMRVTYTASPTINVAPL